MFSSSLLCCLCVLSLLTHSLTLSLSLSLAYTYTHTVPPSIAFCAVGTHMMKPQLRAACLSQLRKAVTTSGAALGVMLHGESLIAYSVNNETPLPLPTSDVVLLAHFVGNSNSLRGRDQNWVPVCLPGFNSRAILQVRDALSLTHTHTHTHTHTLTSLLTHSHRHIFAIYAYSTRRTGRRPFLRDSPRERVWVQV